MAQAASSWAALGAVGPLAVLLQHYPASLAGQVLLGVLAQLPETLNPRLYSSMLPKVGFGVWGWRCCWRVLAPALRVWRGLCARVCVGLLERGAGGALELPPM